MPRTASSLQSHDPAAPLPREEPKSSQAGIQAPPAVRQIPFPFSAEAWVIVAPQVSVQESCRLPPSILPQRAAQASWGALNRVAHGSPSRSQGDLGEEAIGPIISLQCSIVKHNGRHGRLRPLFPEQS
ncbi:hypothetical protein H8959_021281 [Pygathrix nigripes]